MPVGAVVALSYRSAVDDPARFTFSKKLGPWVGLTPSRNQSGERDVSGGITKAGEVNLRRTLCQAATVMMHQGRSTWAFNPAENLGCTARPPPWRKACHGRFGPSHRRDLALDVGR